MRSMPPLKPLLSTTAVASEEGLDNARNRAVAHLAGAASHKLKQPLAVAWGYLELILDDPSTLDPTTLRYLREIQLAVQTMDEVVNRLQRATLHQTRPHLGGLNIVDLDDLPSVA